MPPSVKKTFDAIIEGVKKIQTDPFASRLPQNKKFVLEQQEKANNIAVAHGDPLPYPEIVSPETGGGDVVSPVKPGGGVKAPTVKPGGGVKTPPVKSSGVPGDAKKKIESILRKNKKAVTPENIQAVWDLYGNDVFKE
jgi:hypothetical protein